MKNLVTATGVVLAGLSSGAMANSGSGPFSAEFVIELQSDFTYNSSNPANEFNNTFATIEGVLSFSFSDRTSLNATLVFEQITGPIDDSFLEDHGLYAEELYFAHDFGAAEVVLGKFNPAFGVAWDAAPGIYGVDFAEDYELTEMLGGAINIPFNAGGGEHVLSFALFQADRTILSDSLGEERGQTALFIGGPTNTARAESVAVSLSGDFGRTGYNIGAQHLARGMGDADDQTGFVFGVTHEVGAGSAPFELLGELAWFDGFGGTTQSAFYTTAGIALPVGPVTLSGVFSLRDIDTMPTDRLATITAEMEIVDGLTGAIGFRWADEGGDENHTFGTLLVYEF